MAKLSYDLTTNNVWGSLTDSYHTISVVSRATGVVDSEPSKYKFLKQPDENKISLQLYQNTAERFRVNKFNYLTLVDAIFGTLRSEASVVSPIIVVESVNLPAFNYVYIQQFNRYYYVTDITSVRNNLWEIALDVDVLMTYNNAIRNCTAYIDRNENTYNKYIVDDKVPLQQGEEVTQEIIPNELFDVNTPSFIIQGIAVSSEPDNV